MSSAGVSGSALQRDVSGSVLQRAASMWFLTALAGQWLFVYYISAFYGPTAVSGDYAAWDRNTNMTDGYVAGDGIGNLFFLAHVLAAAAVTLAATLQLVPQIRERAIAFHRWNGRLFSSSIDGASRPPSSSPSATCRWGSSSSSYSRS